MCLEVLKKDMGSLQDIHDIRNWLLLKDSRKERILSSERRSDVIVSLRKEVFVCV